MKSLVADTGPLNYLIQIGAIGCLPALFPRILIPPSVHDELLAPGAPEIVRAWASLLPSWCRVQQPGPPLIAAIQGLSPADIDVLSLAAEVGAGALLDDLAARQAARHLGTPLIGTLGLLEIAAKKDLLSLTEVIDRLRQTNIRVSEEIYAEVMRRNATGR